jgi:hypothetical protein
VALQQTWQNAYWTRHFSNRVEARWKRHSPSVEMFLPDEHKKVLTVAIHSRMVLTEASTGQA